MLHELLLALSGHPSPLFSPPFLQSASQNPSTGSSEVPLLSPSESSLLASLSKLGRLHSSLRTSSARLSSSHPSTICRAVAAAVGSTHLQQFQAKILEVERGILAKDARYVGAYDIVPLSGIVGEFAGWERRLGWLEGVVGFVEGEEKEKAKGRERAGAEVMDWLRREARTGYPDVEAMALDLVAVAERAWVREVAGWVLYGRLPMLGKGDFLVQQVGGAEGEYRIVPERMPGFVTQATANSMLFIGKSLGHVKSSGLRALEASGAEGASLLRENLGHLEGLKHPIAATSLSRAIAAIRSSLAQKALRQLLPAERIVRLLDVLREFFLLGRGEFAVALVGAADECLAGRHLKTGVDLKSRDVHRLGGIMIREGEVTNVLDKTWASLVALQDIDDDDGDQKLDMAREMIYLQIKKQSSNASFITENDLKELEGLFENALLATPTTLTITVPSPLDLFLTPSERHIYSLINIYLLSVRRTHLHLSGLWRLSVLRRGPRQSAFENIAAVSHLTSKDNQRSRQMRPHWAAISSAIFFLAELVDYLQGEVVAGSWENFRQWIDPPKAKPEIIEERDPEILASVHRTYLNALVHALLLTDLPFAKYLKSLISRCDQLVALVSRLSTVQEALQAQDPALNEPANQSSTPHLAREESDIHRNLQELSIGIDGTLKSLGRRLNEIDQERPAEGMVGLKADEDKIGFGGSDVTFTYPRGGGVRNLLMRLDFRAILDD